MRLFGWVKADVTDDAEQTQVTQEAVERVEAVLEKVICQAGVDYEYVQILYYFWRTPLNPLRSQDSPNVSDVLNLSIRLWLTVLAKGGHHCSKPARPSDSFL